uniref:Uncharacterized protein n=1 Tax=Arundo donax TaxID=35708 RepID=A0A0A8YM85_ARUDO
MNTGGDNNSGDALAAAMLAETETGAASSFKGVEFKLEDLLNLDDLDESLWCSPNGREQTICINQSVERTEILASPVPQGTDLINMVAFEEEEELEWVAQMTDDQMTEAEQMMQPNAEVATLESIVEPFPSVLQDFLAGPLGELPESLESAPREVPHLSEQEFLELSLGGAPESAFIDVPESSVQASTVSTQSQLATHPSAAPKWKRSRRCSAWERALRPNTSANHSAGGAMLVWSSALGAELVEHPGIKQKREVHSMRSSWMLVR